MRRLLPSFLILMTIGLGAASAQSSSEPYLARYESIAAKPFTPPVTLVSPAEGANVVAGSLQLTWRAVPMTVSYHVQISLDTFATVYSTFTTRDTVLSLPDLEKNHRYWWRVLAEVFEDVGPFSDMRSFYLQGLSGVVEQKENSSIRGGGVAPDPASGHASIGFSLEAPQAVSLEVFDPLGNAAVAPISKRFDAGDHQLPLDVTALADGPYFYRLTTSASQTTGKFTVRH